MSKNICIYILYDTYIFFLWKLIELISEINNSPEEDDIVIEIKEKKPIFSTETLRNIGYGTLTGSLLFFIIVILCWFIRERMEKDKFKITKNFEFFYKIKN